ncbi:hypothetical protein ACWC5F_32680 [Streptomyces sp. NPDC001272]|uniref:hypothetical protein n=1 Tax=Streptomyces sp. NPDC001591 TaxID=3364589 RepID=UPI0036C7450C
MPEVTQKPGHGFGIIKSGLAAVSLQIGNLDLKVEALDHMIDRDQAQIIELLTQPVGQRPDAG